MPPMVGTNALTGHRAPGSLGSRPARSSPGRPPGDVRGAGVRGAVVRTVRGSAGQHGSPAARITAHGSRVRNLGTRSVHRQDDCRIDEGSSTVTTGFLSDFRSKLSSGASRSSDQAVRWGGRPDRRRTEQSAEEGRRVAPRRTDVPFGRISGYFRPEGPFTPTRDVIKSDVSRKFRPVLDARQPGSRDVVRSRRLAAGPSGRALSRCSWRSWRPPGSGAACRSSSPR